MTTYSGHIDGDVTVHSGDDISALAGVGLSLHLNGCTGLTELPEGLSVGGWLNLSGCTGLTELPEGLSVGKSLYLNGCTGLTNVTWLSERVGDYARMAAVYTTRGIHCISLGCFAGSRGEAVAAIRRKYGDNSDYERVVAEAFDRHASGGTP